MMRILCVSDTVDERLYGVAGNENAGRADDVQGAVPGSIAEHRYGPESRPYLAGVACILAAGDLPGAYLEFLVDLLNVPLYFVFGNHAEEIVRADGQEPHLPWGCVCLDGRVERHRSAWSGGEAALLLAGLGGSRRYRPGPHQYSEAEMLVRAVRLVPRLLWNRRRTGRSLDILLTHSPPWGIQDGPDRPHQGFRAFRWLMDRFRPRYLVHGHYEAYDSRIPRQTRYGQTAVLNAYRSYLLEVVDAS